MKNVTVDGTIHVHTGGDTTQDTSLYSERVGGAIGYTWHTPVTNATSTVAIDAGNKPDNPDWYLIPGRRVGGLFGQANVFGILSKVSAAGNITNASYEVGGIMGRGTSGDIHDALYIGDITFTQDQNYAYPDGYAAMDRVGGIFGTFDSGTVYDSTSHANITLDERAVTTAGGYQDINSIGAFGGGFQGSGDFVRDHATGDVTVHANADTNISQIGGFIGNYNCCGDITSSDSTGSVLVDNAYATSNEVQQIGGFLGYDGCCGSIEDSHATGDVTVSSAVAQIVQVGGFIGQFSCCGGTFNSSSGGDVTVTSTNTQSTYVGGFIGELDDGSAIVNSQYIAGQVTASGVNAVGSLVGAAFGGVSIQGSSASGRVDVSYDGNAMAGGLVGETDGSIAIENSYSTSFVTAQPINGTDSYNAGGLLGYVTQNGAVSITDSFASGHIRATNLAAGLVGNNIYGGMNIENSYFTGEVESTATGATSDMISNGSWASTTPVSVVYNSSYAGDVTTDTGALPKTTTEMQTQSTFTDLGWNFGSQPNWTIDATVNNGYPVPVALSHATSTNYNQSGGAGGGSSFVTAEPTAVTATAVAPSAGDTTYSATVTWTDPTLDSGDAVSSYIVQAFPTSGLPLETITRTKPATVTGLLIGTAYTFKVTVVTRNHGESTVGVGNVLNQAAAPKLAPALPKIPAKLKPSKSALIIAKLGKTTQGLSITITSTTKKVCTVTVTKAKGKITGYTVTTKALAKGKKSAVCTVSVTLVGNNKYDNVTARKVNITVKK